MTASLASGAGSLVGTKTATVTAGVASFADLEDDTAGALSLKFGTGSLPPVISSPSVVSAAPATQLIVTESPQGAVAGVGFGLSVQATDNFGNVDDTFDGSVTVALASGSSGALSGTMTLMASSGLVTFTDLTDTTSGSISFSVTAGALKPATTSLVPVSPGTASKLLIQTEPSPTAIAGQPLANQPVIELLDQFGNLVQGDDGKVVTAQLGSGTGPLEGTLTAKLSHGVATFTDLAENKAGTISLQFTGAGITSLLGAPIVVSPALASKLVIDTQPAASATAGQAFAIDPVVSLEDEYGNVLTGDNSTVVTVSVAGGAGQLQGTQTATVTAGVARFANLGDSSAETITLKFTAGSLSSPATLPIQVAPKPPPPNPTPTVLRTSVVDDSQDKEEEGDFQRVQHPVQHGHEPGNHRPDHQL